MKLREDEREFVADTADYLRGKANRDGWQDTVAGQPQYVPGTMFDETKINTLLSQLECLEALADKVAKRRQALADHNVAGTLPGDTDVDVCIRRVLDTSGDFDAAVRQLRVSAQVVANLYPTKFHSVHRNHHLHRSAVRLCFAYYGQSHPRRVKSLAEACMLEAGIVDIASKETVRKWILEEQRAHAESERRFDQGREHY